MCTVTENRQGEPMRAACADLTMASLPAGHWLPLECADKHVQVIRTWLSNTGLRGCSSRSAPTATSRAGRGCLWSAREVDLSMSL